MTAPRPFSLPGVIAFDAPLPGGTDANALLGGKAANLVEMTQVLGLRVPPGFTVTTEVCREYLAGGWPAYLDLALVTHLAQLGERLGRRLGDPSAPLLVSVRSGAPVSMPGMMDTLLNVGMTPAIRDAMALSGSPQFAADTWLRFCKMYADVVLGVPAPELAQAVDSDGTPQGLLDAAARVGALAAPLGGIPSEPFEQLRGAIAAVFRSWHSERARTFRQREQIPESLGTAVTVQAMVFGNLGARSGTGVVFTRNPATGDPGPFGDYLAGAQGEDVVAGTHAVHGLQALREQVPAAYEELLAVLDRLERHYCDMCDVEFTVSEGTLYILQTRIGRRSPLAAVRIAVAMAEDPGFPLSRQEAVARVDARVLQQLAAMGTVRAGAVPLATGLAASPGIGVGVLCCDPDRAADMAAKGISVVLAREDTSPADIHGMLGAAGIVTTLGGVASHAAVVARSWAIPAVTSIADTKVLATGIVLDGAFIAEGEIVTVDGAAGALYAGDQREEGAVDVPELRTLRSWARELDLQPGTTAPGPADPGRDADVTLLELARTVQLKGLCSPERAAAALSAALQRVEELVNGNAALFRTTPRGVMLTAEGQTWLTERLAAERLAIDGATFGAWYEPFMELNHRFKQIVSQWQMAPGGAPAPDAWPALVEAVAGIDSDLLPVLTGTAQQVRRLSKYQTRFEQALAALREGDQTMLASPLKDSYHTVWFEFHEELITLLDRDRATEEHQSP
jgi:pyruvate,orthophosphate dikinase